MSHAESGRQHYNFTFALLAVAGVSYALLQSLVAPALPEIQHADLERSVTTFQVDLHRGRAKWCGHVLGTVAEHHGEGAHAPPLGAIEVVGTAPTPALRAAFEALTFCEFAPTPSDLAARSRSAIRERVEHATWE